MITIFNRKELLVTYSMSKQSEIRHILSNNKIDYIVRTVNRKSPSPFSAGSISKIGTLGENLDLAYEYIMYVKNKILNKQSVSYNPASYEHFTRLLSLS